MFLESLGLKPTRSQQGSFDIAYWPELNLMLVYLESDLGIMALKKTTTLMWHQMSVYSQEAETAKMLHFEWFLSHCYQFVTFLCQHLKQTFPPIPFVLGSPSVDCTSTAHEIRAARQTTSEYESWKPFQTPQGWRCQDKAGMRRFWVPGSPASTRSPTSPLPLCFPKFSLKPT